MRTPWGEEIVTSFLSELVSARASPAAKSTPEPARWWEGLFSSLPSPSTSPTASATATVTTIVTETHVATPMSEPPPIALPMRFWYQLQHDLIALFENRNELFWAALVLSAFIVLYVAYLQTKSRIFSAYFDARYNAALARNTYPRLWNTSQHWVLSSLISQWLRNHIPGDGIWTRVNAASLRAKTDKSALQKLVRMGIYPLFIQDGGVETVQEEKGGLGPWGGWTWGLYKQSKRRAVFEFAVPRARGWALEEDEVSDRREKERRRVDDKYIQFVFLLCNGKRLRRAGRWRVAASGQAWEHGRKGIGKKTLKQQTFRSKVGPDHGVPSETGATSRFKALLPFKPDRVLRREARVGTGWENVKNWVSCCRLLTSIHVPVVRIEAPDCEYIELDKEILLIAQELGLDSDWDETVANYELRKAYREIDADPSEFLK